MPTRAAVTDLAQVVSKTALVRAWNNAVRSGLRHQVLPDVHDYLDIHRNLSGIAGRISADLAAGRYRPSPAEFVTIEKRDGISRRMAIPDPTDALVLQCLVNTLENELKAAQPSKRAYYSRSHMPPGVERVDGTFAYPWWQLWPEFQEKIFQFATNHKFLVVTDIANYFDTIPLHSLRNVIAAASKISEHVLDLLFFILETLNWRPYYIPHSGVGLPQLNFDAPRLLAHAYLFRVDDELEQATSGTFVRWMDDIDAGVASRKDGKVLLRRLQEVVNSQGLQLNVAKTKILSSEEAVEHFNIRHNRALTIIGNGIRSGVNTPTLVKAHREILRTSYAKFKACERTGHWEKVQKRYLHLFGILRDAHAVGEVGDLLSSHPGMRDAALRYLAALGYSTRRFALIWDFLVSGHCGDDGALFDVVRCLIAWSVPATGKRCSKLLELGYVLADLRTGNGAFPVGASLNVIAKYADAADLVVFLKSHQSIWQHSGWAARQVAGVVPLLPQSARQYFLQVLQDNGLLQGLQVWANVTRISNMTQLDLQLSAYMRHVPAAGTVFPFPKVVLAVALLSGKLSTVEKNGLRRHLLSTVTDPRYRHLIRHAA